MDLNQYGAKFQKLSKEMSILDKRIGVVFLKFGLTEQLNYKFERLESRVDLHDKVSEVNILELRDANPDKIDIERMEGVISNVEKFIKKYTELIDRPIYK